MRRCWSSEGDEGVLNLRVSKNSFHGLVDVHRVRACARALSVCGVSEDGMDFVRRADSADSDVSARSTCTERKPSFPSDGADTLAGGAPCEDTFEDGGGGGMVPGSITLF